MNSYERINKIEDFRIAKGFVLAEVFPLKKKSIVIKPGSDDDIDRHGFKVAKVNHAENSIVPDLKVGDIILYCSNEPLNGFEHKSKRYLLLRESCIIEYIDVENYNCKIV